MQAQIVKIQIMKPIRTAFLFFALLFTCVGSLAQIIPVKGTFQADLAKVIEDYPNHFKNYLGEIRMENPQATEYQTTFVIKEALSSSITRYSAEGKEIWSWEVLMLQSEDFGKAEKKFRSLFQSIRNLSVNTGGDKVVFKGDFEKPAEEKKFTSIVFKPAREEGVFQKLRIDLLLQNVLLEWEVKVIFYDVEREAHEKGESLERKPF